MAITTRNPLRGLHRFAACLALAVVGLIAAGGLVKSLEAGLSVPDWPLSYGGLNPPRWWEIETVRAEHGHRLIAGTVALLTVALAVWTQRRDERRRVRRLAWLAVAAVFAQALLGGITVLFFLPKPVSVSHAALAQVFLCLVTTLAVVTSGWWRRREGLERSPAYHRLARAASWVTGLVFLQILLGAVVRHTGAGLAIPDFPLAFGRLVPPRIDAAIGIHFAHRVGALLVLLAVGWLVTLVLRTARGESLPRAAAAAMALLVLVQVALGALVVLTERSVTPNTLHVATGAALLASSLLLALSARRLAGGGRRVVEPRARENGVELSEVA